MIGVGPNVYEHWQQPAANAKRYPCACGTDIVAIKDNDGIQLGVRSHQRLPEHVMYVDAMTRTGFYEPLPARPHVAATQHRGNT